MKLSIITINLNNASGLKDTVESVIAQTFNDFEYLIIDGGSIDDSIKVIKENEKKINYWVSEKDSGIYDAINKGIKAAKGEYLYFLNSGDQFYSKETLSHVTKDFESFDFIFGSIVLKYRRGNYIDKPPSKLSFSYLVRHGINHQATFTKKSWFNNYGIYDPNFKYTSDWKYLIISLCKNNASYKVLDTKIAFYDPYGLSAIDNEIVMNEKKTILNQYFQLFLTDLENSIKYNKFTINGILNKLTHIKRLLLK